MEFVKAMDSAATETVTENGAFALNTTGDNLVDLFGTIGAMRGREETSIISTFLAAYAENPLIALRILFYSRDIRGGLGERDTFKTIIKYMANSSSTRENIKANMHLIPIYGRWDDLYAFDNTDLEKEAYSLLYAQYCEDIDAIKNKKYNISLLGKWLKSINASSLETRRLGRKTAAYFKLSDKEYRKSLSILRQVIDVVEKKMSAKEFDKINFSMLPALALHRYQNAWLRNVPEMYKEYLESVNNGSAKINTKTLYPYDITRKFFTSKITDQDELAWKNLPNYVEGDNNIVIMADTSGSMTCSNFMPIATSIGLAIYFAERNNGPYHGKFITFSNRPSWITVPDKLSLYDKIKIVSNADWGMNTDLYRACKMILDTAIKHNISNNELPRALVIISDMEIDECTSGPKTFYDKVDEEFKSNGYTTPKVIFWNVNSKRNVFHASSSRPGVIVASGSSVSVFTSVLNGLEKSSLQFVLDTVNAERYQDIKLAE